MTKEEYMYITGIEDEEQLENIMLLSGYNSLDEIDWLEQMKTDYEGVRKYALKLQALRDAYFPS